MSPTELHSKQQHIQQQINAGPRAPATWLDNSPPVAAMIGWEAAVEEVHNWAGLDLTFAGLNVSRAPFRRVKDQPMLHRQPLQMV